MEVGSAVAVRGEEPCCDEDDMGTSDMKKVESGLRDARFFEWPPGSGFDERTWARQHDGLGSTKLLTDESEGRFHISLV